MPDGATPETPEQPPLTISADFLTGSTEVGLDRIRTRLLDLTNRNKLINFRHSNASSLRVVDAAIDPVFARLRDGERIPFLQVPEPEADRQEIPLAKDYAEELGWNTSFDLDDAGSYDESLPVLHYQESLDTVSRKIAAAAKTAIEESGTNMLYLVFGFLEWYEADDSKQAHMAPLMVVPVAIERNVSRGKILETVLEYSGEDIETNLSLVEKMRRDFGLEIPVLDDEDTPEAYFGKFSEILKIRKRWAIRRQITLGLLSFGKLLMYRDLDPKNWPADKNIANHPLVRELFEGSKNASVAFAEEYPIDAPEIQNDVPQLIRDADSSQHSALVSALRGNNLVIEGPPGTGKSQTITNLIAAALARGKTVLFVSEKLAALEVVRSRLDDAGLGIFCLEVHSHKTKKGALINDVAVRYKARGGFRDPRDLDRQISIVAEKKRLLTQYASLINKTVEPFNATIFEILWARDRCGQDMAHHRELLSQTMLPTVIHYTRTQFTEAEHFLSIYAQHLELIIGDRDSAARHPWAWIGHPLGFEEEERTLRLVGEFRSTAHAATKAIDRLKETVGINLESTLHGLEQSAGILAILPKADEMLIEDLLPPCQNVSTRARLLDFTAHVETFRASKQSLSSSVSNVSSLLSHETGNALSQAMDSLVHWGFDGHSVTKLRDVLKISAETVRLLQTCQPSFHISLGLLGCEAPASLSGVRFVQRTLIILDDAPIDRLYLRHPSLAEERTVPLLVTAIEEANHLKETEVSLNQEFDLSLAEGAYTPGQILEYSRLLDSASLWQRLFSGEYKRAVKAYRSIAKGQEKVSRSQMSGNLRAVALYRQAHDQFDLHTGYRELLGNNFRGVHSPWEDLRTVVEWYGVVLEALPEHQSYAAPFRDLLLTARIERLKAIRASLRSTPEHRSGLLSMVEHLPNFISALPAQHPLARSGSLDEILECAEKLARELPEALQSFHKAALLDNVSLSSIPSILADAKRCIGAVTLIEQDIEVQALLGANYRGMDTDIGSIRQTVQFAESIASGSLPKLAIQWLLCADYLNRMRELRDLLAVALTCSHQFQRIAADIASLADSSAWNLDPRISWEEQELRATEALACPDGLAQWIHFLRVRIQGKESGFEKLTTMAEEGLVRPNELVRAFHFVFHNTLARSVFAEHLDLSKVTGTTQEMLRSQFSAADKEAIRLYSERVATLIDKREVPYGNQSGPVRTWSEMALLTNEMNKQKRHIPIRQLILRSARALQALKPCFMMGPLSVAQYLAPGQLRFDLVVMDEASQLRPEDAIGALARGGQLVVVGDPKQLPPTSFFQRVALDAEDDDAEDLRTAVEEGESILDVASTLFQPVRRLRWHYRSRHHSLIAFSNEEFYQRDLIIFPSAYQDDPSLGVKYRFIRNGICENSRNPAEAGEVVEAVLEHMREHPNESLGVVTLNFEQRELVEELLDRRLSDDPAAIAFQERMKGGQETLFVKNLENVQGDERDVIFISTTYGPDSRGNQYNRFGPINSANGHRRLNVLFTRSKRRTVVFSSLDPDKIQTTANSPWGVRALKQYLLYARSGILQQADDGNDQPTNDFERSIGAVLKENGYDVVPQVGVAGFFIDLGVRHPAKPGAFLLGIECDGASYHSGRSARDRDRLRQEILVNLGWKIHRIWSTDWFKSRDSEIKRLLQHLTDLLSRDPAYVQFKQNANRKNQLVDRLTALRDTEIIAAFPSTPAEKGLLNPELLKEFIQKKPKTREDWFRKIPQFHRTNVDSKQVGQYLDRVLDIISECEA